MTLSLAVGAGPLWSVVLLSYAKTAALSNWTANTIAELVAYAKAKESICRL